jgi:hypothetical protein
MSLKEKRTIGDSIMVPPDSGDVLLIEAFIAAARANPDKVSKEEMFVAALKLVTMQMQVHNRSDAEALMGNGLTVTVKITMPEDVSFLA